jgi:hypothetical protein
MIVDDLRRRRELEAVAFGRVITPEDEAAAALALQELRELDERAAAESAATGPGVASGLAAVEVLDDSQAIRESAWPGAWSGTSNRISESLRRFWVVPVVVASIALGAIGGSLATRTAEKTPVGAVPLWQSSVWPETSSSGDARADPAVPQPQNSADGTSAEDWLNQPRLLRDTFPDEPGLMAFGVDTNSTHIVTTEGATNVWIARGSTGSLCLVMVASADGSFQVRCTPPDLFPTMGVSAEAEDGTTAHWSTDGVTVSDPTQGTTD